MDYKKVAQEIYDKVGKKENLVSARSEERRVGKEC